MMGFVQKQEFLIVKEKNPLMLMFTIFFSCKGYYVRKLPSQPEAIV